MYIDDDSTGNSSNRLEEYKEDWELECKYTEFYFYLCSFIRSLSLFSTQIIITNFHFFPSISFTVCIELVIFFSFYWYCSDSRYTVSINVGIWMSIFIDKMCKIPSYCTNLFCKTKKKLSNNQCPSSLTNWHLRFSIRFNCKLSGWNH